MHRSREAGRISMDNHQSRPGDFRRYPTWGVIKMDTSTLWNNLINSLPRDARNLSKPPATSKELTTLEEGLGFQLPLQLRELLMVTNGTIREVCEEHLYPPLLSTEQILIAHLRNAEDMTENSDASIENMEFSYKWMPGILLFAEEDGAGLVIEIENGSIWHWDHDGWFFAQKSDSIHSLLESTIQNQEYWGASP